jgi:hypothetical protein
MRIAVKDHFKDLRSKVSGFLDNGLILLTILGITVLSLIYILFLTLRSSVSNLSSLDLWPLSASFVLSTLLFSTNFIISPLFWFLAFIMLGMVTINSLKAPKLYANASNYQSSHSTNGT